jgi:hypothetical protein
VFTVTGSHLYTDEDGYPGPVHVRITHGVSIPDDGSTPSPVVSVVSVPLTLIDPPVKATGGFALDVATGATASNKTVATFTDPGGAEPRGDYLATIDWGDGTPLDTSTGAISGPVGGVFTVTGSHNFAGHGAFVITTTIHHEGATDATATSLAVVTTPTSIEGNFNPSPIQAGNYIWFSSVLDVSGLSATAPTTVLFVDQRITLGLGGPTVAVPNASITYHPGTGPSTTVFSGGVWYTNVYTGSALSGSQFLSGLAFLVPSNLPGGLDVTWSGLLFTDTPGVTPNWKWAATVYTALPLVSPGVIDYNALDVKPVDDIKSSSYQNPDHAGTLEGTLAGGATIKSQVITGGTTATSGGTSNNTVSYRGSKRVAAEFVRSPLFAQLFNGLGTLQDP